MKFDITQTGKPLTSTGSDSAKDSSSSKAKAPYSVVEITTKEGLSNVQTDWNRLSETAAQPNVFMTFDWHRAWSQQFAQESRSGRRTLCVLALKQDGALAGISPLIHRTASRFGISVRKVEFLGAHADYNDLILGNDPEAQSLAIADYLVRTQDAWDLVDLRDLRDTGNSLAPIQSALSRTDLHYRMMPEPGRYLYLRIDAPWPEMLGRLSRTARHTLRKKQRRLERMGMRVRIIQNPLAEPGLVEKLIALESQKSVQGLPSEPFIGAYPDVFRSLFEKLGPRGWLYLALMEMDGRLVAWHLGFRCGKRLWDYSTAYDRSFSRLSPGTMLIPAILDYGFSHGYSEHDFLRGEEPYKLRWTNDYHQTYRLMIWKKRWSSRTRAFIYLDLKPKVYGLFGRIG
jgi:CelD/BcsL family acetyltransferase involved in cellulose biosynthesis